MSRNVRRVCRIENLCTLVSDLYGNPKGVAATIKHIKVIPSREQIMVLDFWKRFNAGIIKPPVSIPTPTVNAQIIKSGLTEAPNRPVIGIKVTKNPCDR